METSTGSSAKVINLTRFRLEKHVQKAFRMAWQLSEGKPVNASHMLKSVVLANQKDSSPAFAKFSSLLDLSSIIQPIAKKMLPVDLGAMSFAKPMAEAFSVAQRFIQDNNAFWGRDYITTALLAENDPTLAEIASKAGTTIQMIQDRWFEYVTESDRRRKRESWSQWWQIAGVPMPDSGPPTPDSLPTYLLTWNPGDFRWAELEEMIRIIDDLGFARSRWSTGNRKKVTIGARVYLLRQGADPRGLVGTGTIAGKVIEDDHWKPDKKKEGMKALYAAITWDALSREPIVDRTELPVQSGKKNLWSAQSGGVLIPAKLADEVTGRWKIAWERHIQGGIQDIEPRQWIARFNADTGSEDDQLHVERYVNSFARVIASRNLTPPLSIGLFGDWGSGKTFFMDLLHEKIQELCEEEPEVTPPLYWRNICHIQFNAWHYAETNLWASLVSTIFNRLRVFLDGEKDDSDEFNQLLNELEVASELRRQAQEKLDAAIQTRAEAQESAKRAEQELADLPELPKPTDEGLRNILAKSVKEVFSGKVKDLADLLKSAGERSGRNDLMTAADNIENGITTIEDARMLLDETESLSSRAGFWWRILSTAKFHRSKTFWIIVMVLIAIPIISSIIQKKFDLSEQWSQFWAVFAELLTAGSAVIAWLRSQLANAGGVFDQLNSFQKSIERQIEDARLADRLDYETKRDDAIMQEKSAQKKLDNAIHDQKTAAKAEVEAEKALKESTSQARLGRFIRERASSADYDKHLGLIAMVHRDFQRLSDLMEKMREDDVDSNLPRIERIVLYIDDLDRCRPGKVVQVLEAIHLLLFFPLFVVVVGVDSRWVSRALYKHYEDMLVDETVLNNNSDPRLDRAPADSQNYLEKIFQVPFWLRKMDSSAVTRLIRSLIPIEEIKSTPESTKKIEPPEISMIANKNDPQMINNQEPYDQTRAETKVVTTEAESHQESLGEPLAPPTEGLTITEMELEYMDEIAPLMPRTPRSVKRFVNIYRLYKAGLSTPALGRFLGTREKPGNFRAVQVLLALVTGEPRLAQAVFRELMSERTADKRISSLVDILNQDEETWKTTLDALRGFAKGENDIKLSELQQVSALVGRYSVHHMISQAPGESGLG